MRLSDDLRVINYDRRTLFRLGPTYNDVLNANEIDQGLPK